MENETVPRVGLIGVGLLGSAMASRWRSAGMGVWGFDLDATRSAALVAAGGHAAGSSRELVQMGCSIVLSLPDSDVVAAVLDEIEPVLVPGQTLIDTTTGSPEATEAVARRLAERGVAWLDATVAGSSQQMSQGDAVLLVGGDEQAFGRQRPLLEPLARELFWLGPSGSGARMKLVVNLAIGMHRAVLAEALALARALGLDLEQALAVLKATPAYSRVMDTKGLKMVRREFSPQARLAQHLKDVRLMIQSAHGRGQALPLSELHEQILQSRVDRGDGGLDNSAVVRAWFDDPGERFRG